MFKRLAKRLNDWRRHGAWIAGTDISTPAARRAARRHFHLVDHAFLRILWTNLGQVAPGVWRSNQPGPKRVARYRDMGIRAIISLRGPRRQSFTLFEEEACETAGITLHIARLGARSLAPASDVLHLLDLFETVERPFLMHCKSGADRAGLASALYLLHCEGADVARAKQELSLRYLHVRSHATGILGHMLDRYAEDTAAEPMPIRRWIETRYDPAALTESFRAARAGKAAR